MLLHNGFSAVLLGRHGQGTTAASSFLLGLGYLSLVALHRPEAVHLLRISFRDGFAPARRTYWGLGFVIKGARPKDPLVFFTLQIYSVTLGNS